MSSDSAKLLTAAAVAGAAAGTAGVIAYAAMKAATERRRPPPENADPSPVSVPITQVSNSSEFDRTTADTRSKKAGVVASWTRPVVIASRGLEELASTLRKRLGSEEFPEAAGPTLSVEYFTSKDPNMKFNWQRVVGRKIIFLFDTVDQSKLFEQLSLLQALQGFAVPDGSDKTSKWKTYVDQGKYCWGRASHITVVLPWYRPCQMERTSRWSLKDGKWQNSDPEGQWLDVPTAQYLARLLSTPGSVPPLPGPHESLDGMPLSPLWRPPLELLFVELHEEQPISHSVSDLGATIRMERFVPYFLDKFKARKEYAGTAKTFILFPDHGAYVRYVAAVVNRLKLDADHILYINKSRVGEKTEIEQHLFYETGKVDAQGKKVCGKKESFCAGDHVLIIDDFTNSGGTLFGAVNLAKGMCTDGGALKVTIFVSHLVAAYDPAVVENLKKKLHALGPDCRFMTTNTIPVTTDLLKNDPQCQVVDVSDFIADLVH